MVRSCACLFIQVLDEIRSRRFTAFCSCGESYKYGTREREMRKVCIINIHSLMHADKSVLEKTLQTLMKQQRLKVEEIKKKTNYYSTRELLQRYDDSPSGPAVRQRVLPAPTQPNTPQRQPLPPSVQTPNPLNLKSMRASSIRTFR